MKKNLSALCLSLAMLLALTACQASTPPETTPTETQRPTEAAPTETERPTEAEPVETEPTPPATQTQPDPISAEPVFLRIRDGNPGIVERLQNDYVDNPALRNDIPSILIRDAQGLEDFLSLVNSPTLDEGAIFDSEFFAQYDLMVIPRTTTSGSVQHSVEIAYGNITLVTVTAEILGTGTADMCDWLLLVPLSKSEAPAAAIMEGGWTPAPGGLATE